MHPARYPSARLGLSLGFALLALALLGADCGSSSSASSTCRGDNECQDGRYCNGYEVCDPSAPGADSKGCLPGTRCDAIPTLFSGSGLLGQRTQACTEKPAEQRILAMCLHRTKGRSLSSPTTIDEDACTPLQSDYANVCVAKVCKSDADCDDGRYCNGVEICAPFSGYSDERGCDRGGPPCPSEECDETRNTCGERSCTNPDADGDGADAVECGGTDCDDTDDRVYPSATEICDRDHLDEDCDPSTLGDRDADGDGYADSRCGNYQPDGELRLGTDCDDEEANVHPTQAEVCNGTDDDCDGAIDEGVLITVFVDADQDGYGSAVGSMQLHCPGTAGFATNAWDCDDGNAQIFPGSIECYDETQDVGDHRVCKQGEWSDGLCEGQMSCRTQPGRHGICTY